MTELSSSFARTYLFVPGTRPERFGKALASGADAVVLDLEDAVSIDDKAAAPGISRLVFGTLDFALDLDLDIAGGDDGLTYAASRIAIASRVAGLAAPVAGVTPQLDDEARLLADLALARRRGFGAKLCIHPKQVAPIHRALQPNAEALDWARRVLAADAASPGATRLDGRMVDRPVVLQAQRTLLLGSR